jgi:ferritin
MDKAKEINDHATIAFLNWFIEEQVEEEDTVGEINDKVRAMAKVHGLYYHIDHELGHRKASS